MPSAIPLRSSEWANTFEYNTGETEINGDGEEEAVTDEIDVNPYVAEFQERTYLVQRIRRSFSGNLDYQFNPNHNIYLKFLQKKIIFYNISYNFLIENVF